MNNHEYTCKACYVALEEGLGNRDEEHHKHELALEPKVNIPRRSNIKPFVWGKPRSVPAK